MLKIEYLPVDYAGCSSPKERRMLEHQKAYELLEKMLLSELSIKAPIYKRNENGKPYIDNEGVFFNISHTNGLVCCAICDKEIGIDCEIITNDDQNREKFANRFFCENEINLLRANGFDSLTFKKIWTAKEAFIKMRGDNMSSVKKIDTTLYSFEYLYLENHIICISIS